MTDFAPTPEQARCVELFATGEDLVIEAGAGTGKTATLKLLAESTPREGAYLAFNRAIVAEAAQKMPGNVAASTAHGLAFRAIGHQYQHRLDAARMKAATAARILGIDPITVEAYERKRLSPGFLAGVVARAVDNFCQSAAAELGEEHFPYLDGIDLPLPDGRKGWTNNREVRRHLLPAARRAWADLTATDGRLRFNHGHYLKLWHLAGPRIPADFILFDEAQDANPVMLAIVTAQDHAQRVYVGDSQQEIYGFTGAVNALATIDTPHRTFLTQSFRFGPEVARAANLVLDALGAELTLRGTPTIASVVAPIAEPDVILTRTNATAVELALDALADDKAPHIVGGAEEVIRFARGARDLMAEGWTSHPELACFTSWDEVRRYVTEDQQGHELRLLVELVDKFTADVIIDTLGAGMVPETVADLVLSTAHKSKGREWARVRLAGDFPNGLDRDGTPKPPPPEELRLIYVALTRARNELDPGPSVRRLLADYARETLDARKAAPATADHDLGAWVAPFAELPAAEKVALSDAAAWDLLTGTGAAPAPDDFLAALDAVLGPPAATPIEDMVELLGAAHPLVNALPLAELDEEPDDATGDPDELDAPPPCCPSCGRTDVIRGGLVGAHRCTGRAATWRVE